MEDYSRVTGLVSNLDTKGLVNSMLKIERVKVDRVKATQTRMKWKQEGYREIATMLKGLESSYFDLLNKKDDLRLSSNYSTYTAFAKINGEDTSDISVAVPGSANFDKIEIEEIKQLASPQKYAADRPMKTVNALVKLDKLNETLANGENHTMTFQVDGKAKTIELAGNYADYNALKDDLQNKLNDAFGEHVIKLKEFKWENTETNTLDSGISFESYNHDLEYLDTENNQKLWDGGMGLIPGLDNKFDIKEPMFVSLGSYAFMSGKDEIELDVSFMSNKDGNHKDTKVKISLTDTLEDVIKKFNSGQKAAKLSYDKLTKKFTLTSNKMGEEGELSFNNQETELFFNRLRLKKQEPQQAVFKIKGEYITSNSNTIEVDGAKITLNKIHKAEDGKIEITKKYNSDDIKEKMKGFIKKYNEVIEKLNNLVNEKKNYKYDPLTEEQKKDMKKEEIEKWEKAAKSGLFRSDNGLQKILASFRRIFNDKVEGTDLTMKELGIHFTKDYKDGGQLKLDEEAFDKAFTEKRDDAIKLLTGRSKIKYGVTVFGHDARYKQSGVMQRISDVIKDNIKTTRTDTGKRDEKDQPIYSAKGYLVEKAGIKGTATEYISELSMKIHKMNRRIDMMMDALYEKEDKYYMDFARLETAMQRATAQSNSIMGMMGGGMM